MATKPTYVCVCVCVCATVHSSTQRSGKGPIKGEARAPLAVEELPADGNQYGRERENYERERAALTLQDWTNWSCSEIGVEPSSAKFGELNGMKGWGVHAHFFPREGAVGAPSWRVFCMCVCG